MENITKRFGKVTANKDVTLELYKGEILSLLGENGSGKTTLMNMLSGIYFPDEGQIYIDGQPVTIASPKDAFALGIGMIHQHFKLVDVLTAAENVALGLKEPGRYDIKKVAAKVKAIGDKYDEILNDMIPDDDPGVLVPHEAGDGGILAMPLRDNIPDPGRDDWKLTTCPVCGAECWETEIARQALAAEPELRAACTACALRGGRSGR